MDKVYPGGAGDQLSPNVVDSSSKTKTEKLPFGISSI
jgi:hypothetical protein